MFDQLWISLTENIPAIYSRIMMLMPKAVSDTFYMTLISSIWTLALGLPLALVLYTTGKDGLFENKFVYRIVGFCVDATRAIPFIILAFFLIPVSRQVVGSGIGIKAVIFVLIIMAVPFYARVAELSFRNVDKGLIEAARAMGARRLTIIREVILPETSSSLVTGYTVTIIAIISATSLAGYMGAGGLGDLAIKYGYQRYEPDIMISVIILLIVLNMGVQYIGDRLSRRLDKTRR